MTTRIAATGFATAITCIAPWTGCASHEERSAGSVANVWRAHNRADDAPATEHGAEPAPVGDARDGVDTASEDDVIAVVDGRPITRNRVVELLLRSHGVDVLEQLIALEAAGRLADEKGVTIAEPDVHFEFDLALRRLSDPLSPVTSGTFDRATAQRLLDSVLAERNISREELFVTLRRNAYLRRIVQQDLRFTEEQLRTEFDRAYGERVEVRHIQLGTAGEAARVLERLAAGEDFAELASPYSANVASRRQGGLLAPFSARDEEVPALFRQVAFALEPGEISDVVRVGEWHHLIKLDRVLPAESHEFDEVRGELERRLGERLAETRMRELYEELFLEASIVIHDPVLRAQFEQRHPNRKP